MGNVCGNGGLNYRTVRTARVRKGSSDLVPARLLPASGRQRCNVFSEVGADTLDRVAQIRERINLAQLTTGHEAVDDRGSLPAGIAAGEHPIFAAHGHHSQGPLGCVVVDVQIAVAVPRQGNCSTGGVVPRQSWVGAGQIAK